MSQVTATAQAILARAAELGFRVEASTPSTTSGAVLTVSTTFTPGDVDAYRKAESDAYSLLRMIRAPRPGSTWGTDSGSVGGHAGLTGGYMRLSKSGVDKRVLTAIRKAGVR